MKDKLWSSVWELYEGICILCYSAASSVHEIVPRSVRPQFWNTLDNRVTLCTYCHSMIHSKNPADYVELLIVKRDQLLQMLGKTI